MDDEELAHANRLVTPEVKVESTPIEAVNEEVASAPVDEAEPSPSKPTSEPALPFSTFWF
ncbi:hypothetical protein D3C80_2200170 [compost metagenome]